jgi:hypothetical protein
MPCAMQFVEHAWGELYDWALEIHRFRLALWKAALLSHLRLVTQRLQIQQVPDPGLAIGQ